MIVSNTKYNPEPIIAIHLYDGETSDPFLVRIAEGTTIHMSLKDVHKLQLELMAALYEYDTAYKYKESE